MMRGSRIGIWFAFGLAALGAGIASGGFSVPEVIGAILIWFALGITLALIP